MQKTISKADFRKQVIENDKLTIVKFKTDWSGTCQIISPIYNELAQSYEDQAEFFTVDVETEKELSDEFGIIEFPTILFFSRGEVIDHAKGLISRTILISKVENALTQVHNKLN